MLLLIVMLPPVIAREYVVALGDVLTALRAVRRLRIRLLVISAPPFLNPVTIAVEASNASTSLIVLPIPDQENVAIPSISKFIVTSLTEHSSI